MKLPVKQILSKNKKHYQIVDRENKVIVPDIPSLEHAIEIEECLNAKRFPNGFENWYETFYEVVAAFYNQPKTPIYPADICNIAGMKLPNFKIEIDEDNSNKV